MSPDIHVENNRIACRNRYRKRHGIPVDAPLHTRAQPARARPALKRRRARRPTRCRFRRLETCDWAGVVKLVDAHFSLDTKA